MSSIIFAIALILTAAFAITLAVNLRSGRDPFSPWCLVPGMHLLRTSPFLFLVATNPTAYVHPAIVDAFPDLDSAFLWYGMIELMGFVACMGGVSSRLGVSAGRRLPILTYSVSPATLDLVSLGAIGIGYCAYLMILRHVGGLSELLGSLDQRVTILEGMGAYINLMSFAAIGCVLLAYSLRFRFTLGRLAAVCCLSLLTAAMYSTTGGRKLALSLLVSLLIVWHWGVRPIRRPVRMALIVSLVVAPYFVAMPLIRGQRDGLAYYLGQPAQLAVDMLANSSDFIRHLSYCETYVFVTNYFSLDTIWMGRTYPDAITAMMPRQLMPNKPALDEGMYIYTLAQGGYVYPGMPSRLQTGSGWPTETLATMYWNFHLPGVAVGMFVLGCVMRTAYTYLLRSRRSLYSIMVYQTTMFGFALSNARLIQSTIAVTMVTVLFMLAFQARLKRSVAT